MIFWKATYTRRSPMFDLPPFTVRWFERRCDARAAVLPNGYEAFSVEKVNIPLRTPRGLVTWLNIHCKQEFPS